MASVYFSMCRMGVSYGRGSTSGYKESFPVQQQLKYEAREAFADACDLRTTVRPDDAGARRGAALPLANSSGVQMNHALIKRGREEGRGHQARSPRSSSEAEKRAELAAVVKRGREEGRARAARSPIGSH